MPKSKTKARKDNLGRVLQNGETQRKTDGLYCYTYYDVYGIRRYVYSKELLELRKKEKELLRSSMDGLDAYTADRCTLNDAFDRYMTSKNNLRETTRTNYEYMYDHFVRDTFGKRIISTIKYSDVKRFYLELINQKHVMLNTMDSIQCILHPTFSMSVRDDIIRKNPSDGVLAEIKKNSGKNKGIRHALTPEQQKAFIDYVSCSPEYLHWLPLIKVLLGTGCRIGEVIGLRWKDIDMDNGVIDINHSVTYYVRGNRKSQFGVSLPKTEKGIRKIPMIPEVKEAFQAEYDKQCLEGFCTVELDGMSGFVFSNRFGNLFTPSVINKAFHRIRDEYNSKETLAARREKRQPLLIPHFSCHHLRHTFCSRLCEAETNLKVIQEVMGHANIETTLDIYAEVSYNKKKEALDVISSSMRVF